MYNLSWNDAPAGKPILSKSEIIDYSKHFGQATQELLDFLERFNFDEWICMELFVDYIYGKIDKKGEVGSDAVAYLGIITTTFFTDEGEIALDKYIGKDKFPYPEDRPSFQTFDDCPLWVIQVIEKQKQDVGCLFFMPAIFWKDAQMRDDSYGYEKYGVWDKYNKWYREPFGKSPWQNLYWRKRLGKYSPNFIERDTSSAIEFGIMLPQFDQWTNRVLFYEYQNPATVYYHDLADSQTRHEVQGYLTDAYNGFIHPTPDGYEFNEKGSLIVTDKHFDKISKTKTKIVNSFEDDYWNVVLDTKGIVMTKKETGEEKRFKYSEFNMTNSASSNNPSGFWIRSNANHSVVFLHHRNIIVVDSDFNLTLHPLDKLFKKEIPLYFNHNSIKEASIGLSGDRQILLTSNGVFAIGPDEKPVYLNPKLTAITGEAIFYSAVKDDVLSGIWFIAGNDRLVFTDENFEKGYVFNFTEQIANPHRNELHYCKMLLDEGQNLWYSLYRGKMYKINRKELEAKLKTAIPYSASGNNIIL